ncbi:hypothetical protein D3C81_1730000 [compost metagenome]
MQLKVFQHQGWQLAKQPLEEAANLRVTAAYRQHDLVARQLGFRVDAQGVFAACQADVLGTGQVIQALDQFAGLRLTGQLLTQGVEGLLLGFDGDFQLAALHPPYLHTGVRLAGAQFAHGMPVRQHTGQCHTDGQQTNGDGSQAHRAYAAQVLLNDQAAERIRGAHGRSPRWR